MAIKEPESMDELVYFSNRSIGEGKASAWVYRGTCPSCKKGIMGKPKDPKTGKAKIRAKEYECPECHNIIEKQEYEDTLTVQVKYTCPKCSYEGEAEAPFKWKGTSLVDDAGKKKAVKAIKISCDKCKEVFLLTKKMKS